MKFHEFTYEFHKAKYINHIYVIFMQQDCNKKREIGVKLIAKLQIWGCVKGN